MRDVEVVILTVAIFSFITAAAVYLPLASQLEKLDKKINDLQQQEPEWTTSVHCQAGPGQEYGPGEDFMGFKGSGK